MNHPPLHKAIFIIVPRLGTAGPEKGALALASLLGTYYKVFLITFKESASCKSTHFQHIDLYSGKKYSFFSSHSSLCAKVSSLSKIYSSSILISFCLSADLHSLFLRQYFTLVVSSVRGHLLRNYVSDFGFSGYVLSFFHLLILCFFDKRIIMDPTMNRQLLFSFKPNNHIIPNLVRQDIPSSLGLTFEPTSDLCILFIGSLTPRKDPLSLIALARSLLSLNKPFKIIVLGDGPLRIPLLKAIHKYCLGQYFDILGYIEDPYPIINSASLIFHPSFSEGTSRSCLEALQLGVPCLVRNTESNRFFVLEGYNGFLFSDYKDLPTMVQDCSALKLRNEGKSLLLSKYTDDSILNSYINLFEKIDE